VTGWTAKRLSEVPSVPDLEPGEPDWKPLGHHLRLRAFGANAYTAAEAGGTLLHEHDERAGGHEELYVVLSGLARFRLDGTEVEAGAATAVAITDARVRRSAVALEPGTTVLALGAKPGEPYAGSTWRPEWFEHVPQIPADEL
jgi:hypothetical protein